MNTSNLAQQRKEAKGRMPELRILKLEPDYLQFEVSGTDVSVVNALRRIIYSEVIDTDCVWSLAVLDRFFESRFRRWPCTRLKFTPTRRV